MNEKDLIDFEKGIADSFNNAKIKAPIHLHGNNEKQLIEIFKSIKQSDWVFSSWRSHYHCLLKGVPTERLSIASSTSSSAQAEEVHIYLKN